MSDEQEVTPVQPIVEEVAAAEVPASEEVKPEEQLAA